VIFTETWSNENFYYSVPNFKHHTLHRVKNVNRCKRPSGGLIVYIHERLSDNVEFLKTSEDCVLWVRLKKCSCSCELANDVLLCVAYNVPKGSSREVFIDRNIFEDDAWHHITPSPNSSYEPLPVQDHYDTDDVTRRTGHQDDADGDNEDFTQYTRKRTKHYCVLRFNKTLNVDLFKKVITSKGRSVSWVRVYPPRRNSSKVILRLNLNDDELCDRVLHEGFFPVFVTCKRLGLAPSCWNTRYSDDMTTGSRRTYGAPPGGAR